MLVKKLEKLCLCLARLFFDTYVRTGVKKNLLLLSALPFIFPVSLCVICQSSLLSLILVSSFSSASVAEDSSSLRDSTTHPTDTLTHRKETEAVFISVSLLLQLCIVLNTFLLLHQKPTLNSFIPYNLWPLVT